MEILMWRILKRFLPIFLLSTSKMRKRVKTLVIWKLNKKKSLHWNPKSHSNQTKIEVKLVISSDICYIWCRSTMECHVTISCGIANHNPLCITYTSTLHIHIVPYTPQTIKLFSRIGYTSWWKAFVRSIRHQANKKCITFRFAFNRAYAR
jgi:hypothetical protein